MPAYDAFISYSHAADSRLAPALQRALQRFAKPWWKLRALNLFRDETSLAAASNLSAALLKALDTSRFFILMASPRAATSRWCNEEVAQWLGHKPSGTLLIVLTDGAIAWDEATNDFDWSRTDALPPVLKGALPAEPFWLDLSWARRDEHLSARDPRFQQVVAKLAATLHGRGLEDISGEDVRQHRVTRRLAMAATAVIAALAIGAGLAAWEATRARDEAERQRAVAQKSEAEAKAQRDAAEKALAQTLDAADTLVVEIAHGLKDFTGVPRARMRAVLQKAERILDALPADAQLPAVELQRMEMAQAFVDVLLVLGDTADAKRRAAMAMDIATRQSARAPGDTRWRYGLASSLARMGAVQKTQEDLAGALRSYIDSRDILERLVKDEPGNGFWQDALATTLERLGGVHEALGDFDGALRAYEANLAIEERRAKAQPEDEARQYSLSMSLGRLGDAQSARGDLPEALRSYEASRQIAEKMAKADPANAARQFGLSIALGRLGDVLIARGEPAPALQSLLAARDLLEGLVRADSRNAEWQHALAAVLDKAGDAHMARSDWPAASHVYDAARVLMIRLADSDQDNAVWQRDLAQGWRKLADAQAASGDLATARRSAVAACDIAERLIRRDQGNAEWQFELFVSYWRLADIAERTQGRLTEAAQTWRRALSVINPLAARDRLKPHRARLGEEAKARLIAVDKRLSAGEQ